MKKLYIFALVATMFAACATDATEDVAAQIETPDTLVGTLEGDDSRIQLQNGKTVWTKGDEVSVFYLSNANQKWQYQGDTGERTGNLKRVANAEATQEMPSIVVVYPYNENYYINPRTCNVKAFLPAEQTYLKDSYGLNGNIMISQSEYNQFSLKNVCGWLKVQLNGEGQVVRTITLKGNNGEQVAGEIYINSADATATLANEIGNADDAENGAGGNLVFDNTILTEVTLNCGEGVELGAEPTAFYIALPPQTFEKGISLEIVAADGSTMKKSTENEVVIERNHILPMAELVYDGYIPPVYELAYTTNDGQPLDPYTTEGFGANFVENIYDATTGQGALKFDGTITTIPEKAFVACGNLTGISLTNGIDYIRTEAFYGCSKLAIVHIPSSVRTIGSKAFYGCNGMQEITIPSSVTHIGTSSFEGCGGKATISCNINYNHYTLCQFFYKAKFTEAIITDSVTSIGDCAFKDCSSLTSITIPYSVTFISSRAFTGCSNLKKVYYQGDLSAWCKITFEASISDNDNDHSNPCSNGAELYIGGNAVSEVVIPSDITEIKHATFDGCVNITKIDIHNNVISIRRGAFYACSGLTSIILPNRITSIENKTFYGCSSLKSVVIPNRVSSIGEYAFYDCSSLTNVTIPNSVTSIGNYAFDNCTSLTSITIPDSVTSIGDFAFSDCTSLTSITIPNSVSSIGIYTFYNCNSLASITIPDSVTSIGDSAFQYCKSLASITIPNSVTSIGDWAFYSCNNLASITIPNSVTSIGYAAFYHCDSLTSVTIPDSVTSIGEKAFAYCHRLKDVYCKPTTPPTATKGYSGYWEAFESNASDRKIYVPTASVDTYKAAQYWSDYADCIVGYDF